jgi:hypothetical protein
MAALKSSLAVALGFTVSSKKDNALTFCRRK